jgi:peptide/nickel transport system substrate-binding protein
MTVRPWTWLALLLVVLTACAPSAPATAPSSAPRDTSASVPSAPGPASTGDPSRKTITIGVTGAFNAFSVADTGNTSSGGVSLQELWLQSLVTSARDTPSPEPRIAVELPSIEKGSMRIEPDGRMTVTWKLRDDVKWADGTPLTAQDFVFAYQIVTDERLTFTKSGFPSRLHSVAAPDDRTFVMVWKEPYYLANAIGTAQNSLTPLPRHVLEAPYNAGNVEAFENHPYWNTQFFHVGPYRPVRFEPQVELLLQPVPNYFLGAPKVGNIVIKFLTDTNVAYAALLAGSVDTVLSNALSSALHLELKERWESSGEGKVHTTSGNTQFISFQHSPEYQTEPAFLDPKVRQALAYAIDRPAWTDVEMGGKTSGLVATGLLPPNHHLASYTNNSLAMYTYDLNKAQQMLADAGWVKGSDGFITHRSDGRRFKPALWSTTENSIVIVADYWKQVGIDASTYVIPRARLTDRQFWQSYPSLEISARGWGDEALDRVDCLEVPTPATSFGGQNRGHYCDTARMQPLLTEYKKSLNAADQGRYLKQIAELSAQELPILQTYFSIRAIPVAKGAIMMDDFGGGLPGSGTYGSYYRNAHLWDRQ